MAAGDPPLELVRGALGDDPAVVEDGDPVGELVGLVEVLRGEEDRDAAGGELADARPTSARRLRGSSPVVGSSRKITRGEPTSVIARSSRRRIPPE